MKLSAEDRTTDYFNNLKKELSNPDLYDSKGKKLASFISQKMQQKIIFSQIQLPDQLHTKQLKIEKKIAEPYTESEQSLLRKVQNQKMHLQQKMIDLEKQQYELKTKIKSNSSRQKLKYNPAVSQQDNIRLKQLIKQNRRFERSLERRNKQLAAQYREKSIQEMKYLEEMLQKRKQQKRIEVLQKLKSLQLKSAERKQILEAGRKAYKNAKENSSYLYLVNSQRDIQLKQEKDRQYVKKLEQFKKGLKVDFEQIKQHERKYDQHLQQSQVRMQQRSLQRSQHQHQRSKSYADNYFRIVTKARMQQQKAEQYEKMNYGHDIKERICKFQQKLSTQFKPKISKESVFKPIKQTMSAHTLTTAEQRQKGIQYLQVAKKLKDIQKEKQKRATQGSPQIKHEYKDYTKSLKYKGHQAAQTQFNSIVKTSRSVSDYESATKALQLANKIQANSKLSNDRKLLNSVKNKIDFLNALE